MRPVSYLAVLLCVMVVALPAQAQRSALSAKCPATSSQVLDGPLWQSFLAEINREYGNARGRDYIDNAMIMGHALKRMSSDLGTDRVRQIEVACLMRGVQAYLLKPLFSFPEDTDVYLHAVDVLSDAKLGGMDQAVAAKTGVTSPAPLTGVISQSTDLVPPATAQPVTPTVSHLTASASAATIGGTFAEPGFVLEVDWLTEAECLTQCRGLCTTVRYTPETGVCRWSDEVASNVSQPAQATEGSGVTINTSKISLAGSAACSAASWDNSKRWWLGAGGNTYAYYETGGFLCDRAREAFFMIGDVYENYQCGKGFVDCVRNPRKDGAVGEGKVGSNGKTRFEFTYVADGGLVHLEEA